MGIEPEQLQGTVIKLRKIRSKIIRRQRPALELD